LSNATPPPHNLDAEESIIGAAMLSANALSIAEEIIEPHHFYRPSNGIIFKEAQALAAEGQAVDYITLSNALETRGLLEKAGGRERLQEIAGIVPAASNVGHYAKIVREMAGLRALLNTGIEITKLAQERNGTLDELIEQSEKALSEAVEPTIGSNFATLDETMEELLSDIREAIRTDTPIFGTRTGLVDLDNTLTGLHPGTLTLLAARPGMGKSALALNIAENIVDQEETVAFLTLEMSKRELLIRSFARESRIDSQRIRMGLLNEDEQKQIASAKKTIDARKERLLIEDTSGMTNAKLRAEIRRLHRQSDVKLIVVDYLQLMLATSDVDSRQEEIAAISRSLKLLAKELHIPVLALSQLNRKLEGRNDKRPNLADLRDSGALEQDADVVLFLYRDEYYNPDSKDVGVCEAIIAKNRMGPSNTIKLAFNARFSTFKNIPGGSDGTSE
jgi:replicative DNA helicase